MLQFELTWGLTADTGHILTPSAQYPATVIVPGVAPFVDIVDRLIFPQIGTYMVAMSCEYFKAGSVLGFPSVSYSTYGPGVTLQLWDSSANEDDCNLTFTVKTTVLTTGISLILNNALGTDGAITTLVLSRIG